MKAYDVCGGSGGNGVNSALSRSGSFMRPARQSALACAIRSFEEATKFHSMKRSPMLAPPSSMSTGAEHCHLTRCDDVPIGFRRSGYQEDGAFGMVARQRDACAGVQNHMRVEQRRMRLHRRAQAQRLAGEQP